MAADDVNPLITGYDMNCTINPAKQTKHTMKRIDKKNRKFQCVAWKVSMGQYRHMRSYNFNIQNIEKH